MTFKLKMVRFFAILFVSISTFCNHATAQNVPLKVKAKPADGIEDDLARKAKVDVESPLSLSELISKGATSVNPTTGDISIKVDVAKLDPKVLAKLKTQKIFKVDAPFEISNAITNPGFEKAKIAKPSKPLTVKAGTYSVENQRIHISIYCEGRHCRIDIWL